MDKVLVTGVNGFVGQHVASELANHGIKVLGVGGPGGNTRLLGKLHEYLVIDLLDAEATKAIDFSEVTGVIHLAGLAAVGPSFDEPRRYMESNIGMEINLFEAAQKQGAHPKFVIISSGSLYNPASPLPITENTEVLPNSPYAVSKLGQEQMARYYVTRGFEVVIARPFNHIGPGQNPGFIVPDLTQQAVAFENIDLDKITTGNLDARRDYTDVRDIARAYRLLLEKGVGGEIYNICSGKSTSGHELLDKILTIMDVHPEIAQDPSKMRPSDAPDIYGSHDKITQDTAWAPIIDIETTLKDVISDWRNRK